MTNQKKVMKGVYKVKTYDNNECPIFDARSVKYFGNECVSYVSDEFIKKARTNPNLLNKFFNIIANMSKDEARSLLLIRIFLLNDNWDLSHLPNNDYPALLVRELRGLKSPLEGFNGIIQYMLNVCVPDINLNWFKKDLRASLFIAYLVERKIRSKVFKGKIDLIANITESLKYRVHIFNEIYEKNLPNFLYYRDVYGDEKTAHIEFVEYLYLKNRTAEKDLSWVNPSNKKQIDWMYDYLDGKIFEKIILKRIFFPEDTNEKYQQILASLDILSNVPDDKVGTQYNKGYSQRSYVIASMRNAWKTQTNYRKIRPSIKERYVKIYKENYERLDEIAKSKKLTDNQLVNDYLLNDLINLVNLDAMNDSFSIKLSENSYRELLQASESYDVSAQDMIEDLIKAEIKSQSTD